MQKLDDIADRVRAEYLEMPGLRLRADQIRRLCAIEQSLCDVALAWLVRTGFLSLKPDGCYIRPVEESSRWMETAKTALAPAPSVKRAS